MASRAQVIPLLGVCEGDLDPKRHQSSFLTNKIGGLPDFLPGFPRSFPRCGSCQTPLAHVVQVYCPLEASPYHRDLHLFACPGTECLGRAESWKVLRSQALEVETSAGTHGQTNPPQDAPLAATDWCDAADDWGMEEEEKAAAPQADGKAVGVDIDVSSLQLHSLRLSEPPSTQTHTQEPEEEEEEEDIPVLRSHFINVYAETDLSESDFHDLKHAENLLKEYERREGLRVGDMDEKENGNGGGGTQEKYEKSKARHGDAIFSRFMKKISLCPQQILRYCRGEKPLFITEPPENLTQLVSMCGTCGSPRTFEMQLMPALVSLLRWRDDRKDGSGSSGGGKEVELEFGTVLVYTCKESCWKSDSRSAVEEFCFVQMDPDQQLFK